MRITETEGHDTVPLRLPTLPIARPPRRLFTFARAATVIGLASAPIAGLSLPAQADVTPRSEWWLGELHVTQASRTSAGAGVTVAVLADGVDVTQPDLTGRVISGPDFTRSNRTAATPHYGVIGTGLASLIVGHGHGPKSASGNSPSGIDGIAAAARVLAVRVTLSPGDPLWSSTRITSRLPADIAAGIRYAVLHKASVILLPADPGLPGIHDWGGVGALAGGSAAERSAVAFAVKHNVVLVAPAGDNALAGDASNYPAAYPGVVAVGAFGRNFVKAPYSCRRSYVTLTAAGAGVSAAAPSGYQTMDSTWAASAIVAGVATLIRSRFPNLTAAQVTTAMTESTVYHPPNAMANGGGHGTVDAMKAMLAAATMSPPHAKSAFLGALPRQKPVMPHVQSQASIIEGDLVRDGAISAAALAALLVPIVWYGAMAKRRDRQLALAMAERERQVKARGQYGMLADPLLEFFGPMHTSPGGSQAARWAVAAPKFQPRPALTGRSTLTSAFPTRPMLAAPPTATSAWSQPGPSAPAAAPVYPGPAGGGPPGMPPRAGSAAGPDAGAGAMPGAGGVPGVGGAPGAFAPPGPGFAPGGGAALGAGAASRPDAWTSAETVLPPSGHMPQTLSHAPVSGSPPWEPAPRPTSELPWTMVQGPPSTGGPPAGRAGLRTGEADSPASRSGPPQAAWESRPAAESSAPRAIYEPEQERRPKPDRAGMHEPFQRSTDSAGRPIYTWNPTSSNPAPSDPASSTDAPGD